MKRIVICFVFVFMFYNNTLAQEGNDEVHAEFLPEYSADRGDSGRDLQTGEWVTDSEFSEDETGDKPKKIPIAHVADESPPMTSSSE